MHHCWAFISDAVCVNVVVSLAWRLSGRWTLFMTVWMCWELAWWVSGLLGGGTAGDIVYARWMYELKSLFFAWLWMLMLALWKLSLVSIRRCLCAGVEIVCWWHFIWWKKAFAWLSMLMLALCEWNISLVSIYMCVCVQNVFITSDQLLVCLTWLFVLLERLRAK